MKFNLPVNNFAAGEWSARMKGRTDTEQYLRACEELTNFIPQMTGGAEYRGGTFNIEPTTLIPAFDTLVNGGSTNFKLVPYMPANNTYRNILAIPVSGVWKTLPDGVDVTGSGGIGTGSWDPSLTDYAQVGDLLIMTCKNGVQPPRVFYRNPVGGAYTLSNMIGGYVTSKPWKANPWGKINAFDSSVTMGVPASAGTVGTSLTLSVNAPYFVSATHVGRYIRVCYGTDLDGVLEIMAVLTTQTATAIIRQILPSGVSAFTYGITANPTSFWQISEWGGATGWPRTVTSHQGRLVFGGNDEKPDTIWGSRISNIFDFQEVPAPNTTGAFGYASNAWTTDGSRPFTLAPNTGITSSIKALSSSKTLMINTELSEIVAYGSNGALGPNNVVFESSTSFGASAVSPVRINNYLTFVQGNGSKVRDLIYNFDQSQYKSNDLAFAADHYYDSMYVATGVDMIKEMTRWENKSSVLVVRTQMGKAFCVTLDRDYEINAWSRITLGVSPAQEDQDILTDYPGPYPFVCSMCTMIDPITGQQDLYLATVRYVNGLAKFCLEKMMQPWRLPNPYNTPANWALTARPNYLDFATYCDPVGQIGSEKVKTWKAKVQNSNYYLGDTVSVVGDGTYLGEFTVGSDTDGNFTLDTACSEVIIGYKYRGVLKTFPIEAGGQTGTPMGRIKKVDEMTVRFYNSIGCLVGHSEDTLEDIPMRETSQPMNESPNYFTGDKVITFPAGYERDYQILVVQDKPYPLHIVAVAPQGVTYD